MSEITDPYKMEKERSCACVGLVAHALFFLLVNTILTYVYVSSGGEKYWIAFPLIGWGMGLYLHARSTYFFSFYNEKSAA